MKKQKTIITASIVIFMIMTIHPEISRAAAGGEMVILLHGMGRYASSMNKIAHHLEASGYTVLNVDYASRKKSIQEIAEQDVAAAVQQCRDRKASRIHFVTHSLGGIVVRQYLQHETLPEGSRVIMLSPPNKGSELAEYLKEIKLYQYVLGPAGQALGTGDDSVPNSLSPINPEIGIITGNKRLTPDFLGIMDGPNDGKVSVTRSRLDEMSDFIVVPATHTFIMRHPVVLEQVVYFLKNGKFKS